MLQRKILTVDLEDWFHLLDHSQTQSPESWELFSPRIENNTLDLLNLFEKHKVTATFFVLGWIAEQYPDLVRDIVKRGHHIGTHSHYHQLAYEQTPLEFEADLCMSLESINKACGVWPTSYRAPGFSIGKTNLWAFDVLVKNGITEDCSVFPARRAHGGLKEFPVDQPCLINSYDGLELLCFPMTTGSFLGTRFVFSGGGYFRFIPHFLLSNLFEYNDYVMTYFHPRDFDPDQPKLHGLSALRRFKSYYGLKSAKQKLDMILTNFQFCDLRTAILNLDRTLLPSLELKREGKIVVCT